MPFGAPRPAGGAAAPAAGGFGFGKPAAKAAGGGFGAAAAAKPTGGGFGKPAGGFGKPAATAAAAGGFGKPKPTGFGAKPAAAAGGFGKPAAVAGAKPSGFGGFGKAAPALGAKPAAKVSGFALAGGAKAGVKPAVGGFGAAKTLATGAAKPLGGGFGGGFGVGGAAKKTFGGGFGGVAAKTGAGGFGTQLQPALPNGGMAMPKDDQWVTDTFKTLLDKFDYSARVKNPQVAVQQHPANHPLRDRSRKPNPQSQFRTVVFNPTRKGLQYSLKDTSSARPTTIEPHTWFEAEQRRQALDDSTHTFSMMEVIGFQKLKKRLDSMKTRTQEHLNALATPEEGSQTFEDRIRLMVQRYEYSMADLAEQRMRQQDLSHRILQVMQKAELVSTQLKACQQQNARGMQDVPWSVEEDELATRLQQMEHSLSHPEHPTAYLRVLEPRVRVMTSHVLTSAVPMEEEGALVSEDDGHTMAQVLDNQATGLKKLTDTLKADMRHLHIMLEKARTDAADAGLEHGGRATGQSYGGWVGQNPAGY